MPKEFIELNEDVSSSPLYSEDLAPVRAENRTWGKWDLAAIWVGMAVCIPTYLLASYMIKSGLNWIEALIIIVLGNIIITVPMVLNGHAGVKYGVPFPVIGRASFGTRGIHLAAIVRGIVACGWFGIQTWIGGLAFYAIWHALAGSEPSLGLDFGKFVGFFLFWLLNVYFIWKGTESIKWLEDFAAPILILIGIVLIVWGAYTAGGFGIVLRQSDQLAKPTGFLTKETGDVSVHLFPITDKSGQIKADEYKLLVDKGEKSFDSNWQKIYGELSDISLSQALALEDNLIDISNSQVSVQFRKSKLDGLFEESSIVLLDFKVEAKKGFWGRIWQYLMWLTAMVGFWATMAISIADITRYTSTQKNQVAGQFIGLPGTMALFSFVGIFVTCAALINFNDILVAQDAPWDPVSLIGKFSNPVVVIIAQIFMIIATLSTNIAANVIAPANAFSNILPSKISFRTGGIITAVLGILIAPWWLMDEISGLLIFVSGFLGPVLGILICDYYVLRKTKLSLVDLFKEDGKYSYGSSGINMSAMIAFLVGILVAMTGLLVPKLSFLYTLSWFTSFFAAFLVYYFLMKDNVSKETN
jgi:cytosine/uracil/thiamine/allantoin permease